MKRLSDDIRKNIIPIILVIGIWLGLNKLFHNFCPVVLLCGFPCPGCGLTRAFFELAKFNPVEALRYNPAYPLWLGLILAAVWRRYVRGLGLSVLTIPLVVTLVVTMAVYVVRMVWFFPGHPPINYEKDNLFAVMNPLYDTFVRDHFL